MPTPVTDRPEYVIADAIAAAINAATFTGPITTLPAVVDEAPDYENLDNPSNTTPKVSIVPGPNLELECAQTRGGDFHQIDLMVILTKRLALDTECRAMVDLRWQIQDRLRAERGAADSLLAGVPLYWDMRALEAESTFNREGLRGPKVFQAVLRIQFSAMLSR
jgi:hypothetical protein